jgi:AI-2 transport protein TqsA
MVKQHSEQSWLTTASLVILAVVALGVALIYTRTIMVPFVVALFLVALVSPIQDFQVKCLRLPRIIAVIVTLLVVLCVLSIVSLFVAQAIRTIASTAGEYSDSFAKMANQLLKPVEYLYSQQEAQSPSAPTDSAPVQAAPPVMLPDSSDDDFHEEPEVAATETETEPKVDVPSKGVLQRIDTRQIINDLIINTKQVVRDVTNRLFDVLRNTMSRIFGLISGVLFIIIFVIFLLAGRNPYAGHSQMYMDVVGKIRRYLATKVVTSAAVGLLVWGSLAIIGLELAGVFGVLAFLFNFIPAIGPIIVTLLPIPIAVAQFQSPWPVILVIGVPGIIHNVIGNILEPKLMGEGLDLHPVTILLALSFWGLLWGIVGMFLATPITAVLRLVLLQFDTLRPIGNLLAGEFTEPETTGRQETLAARGGEKAATPSSSPPEAIVSAGAPRE